MKSHSPEKSRLPALRELLELSQKEFAERVGITQGALSQLERGRSKLSLDTIRKISLTFNVNCNWLVNGRNDIFLNEAAKEKPAVRQSVITRDLQGNVLIPLIREEAHAGYGKSCQDTEYLHTLDVYKIPGYESGNYRLFEVNGDSMMPSIHPREIVVGEFVEEWEALEMGSLCVVVRDDGIVVKRAYFVKEDAHTLILKSDNPRYKTISVPVKDVKEIWRVQAKITHVFPSGQMIDASKIESLESDIRQLKEQMMQMAQGGFDRQPRS